MIIRFANKLDLIDEPNQRSGHRLPTPRGGGLAIIFSFGFGMLSVYWLKPDAPSLAPVEQNWLFILLMGLALGITGLLDDRAGLSAKARLGTQLVISLSACMALQPLNEASIPLFGTLPLLVLNGLALIGLLWWLNLFNFMDGLDGLAVGQALFMLVSALLAISIQGAAPIAGHSFTLQIILLTCAALLGFLAINWHPARIFLGDCGSLSVGFMLFSIAMVTINLDWLSYHFWLIIGALFVCDSTQTLLVRIKKREKLTEAHRQHFYQVLKDSAGWGQSKVASSYLGFNAGVLLPLALLAQQQPESADLALVCAYLLTGLSLGYGKKWAKDKAAQTLVSGN